MRHSTVGEIDGDWHYRKGQLRDEDKERDLVLSNLGYFIFHIRNQEVMSSV